MPQCIELPLELETVISNISVGLRIYIRKLRVNYTGKEIKDEGAILWFNDGDTTHLLS